MNKKLVVVGIVILLFSVGLSGCIEEAKDTNGDGYNDGEDAFPDDPDEWKDSDNDGVGDNGDAFPYDSTQWADRDGDGYGDKHDGINPDAFPDDPNEWRDSDSDGIGDNADIFDGGNGGIKVAITKYEGDGYPDNDEYGGIIDPYFEILISVTGEMFRYNLGGHIRFYPDTLTIMYPATFIVDIDDDIDFIVVQIMAKDKDFYSVDDKIDLDGTGSGYIATTRFYPQQTSYQTYTADGRLDLLDEMDGYIEYYVNIVEI